jgi:hypothetical protein
MAGTIVVDRIESDGSYASTINVASKVNFTGGMQIGGQDTTFGGMRNRIINGAMMIDQRNAGASVALSGAPYILDRWQIQASEASKLTSQQSTTAPVGFKNSFQFTVVGTATPTSTQAYRLIHKIEGYNVADLGWGTVNAQPITLSFWVRSSVTGTFGAGVSNSNTDRSYLVNYTINQSNTWEYKTITVPGDTSGSWLTDSGLGLYLNWGLGIGPDRLSSAGSWQNGTYFSPTGSTNLLATNGATWYITGVQVEKGSVATPFEQRLYGQELAMCQRYFSTSYSGSAVGTATSTNAYYVPVIVTGSYQGLLVVFPVTMRTSPTVTSYSTGTGASGKFRNSSTDVTTAPGVATLNSMFIYAAGVSMTATSDLFAHYTASAEL